MRFAPIVGALTFALVCLSACSKPPTWKEYSYPTWGFSISFKGVPTTQDNPAARGAPHSFQAMTQNDDMTAIALAADNSANKKPDAEAMTEVANNMASGVNGSLKGMHDITLGAVPGKEFYVSVDRQPTQRIRVFIANKRLYQVVAVSSKGVEDPDTLAFLNGFKITP